MKMSSTITLITGLRYELAKARKMQGDIREALKDDQENFQLLEYWSGVAVGLEIAIGLVELHID